MHIPMHCRALLTLFSLRNRGILSCMIHSLQNYYKSVGKFKYILWEYSLVRYVGLAQTGEQVSGYKILYIEWQILGRIQRPNSWMKSRKNSVLAIHSHLYSFALRFLSISSNSCNLLHISSNSRNILHISTVQLLHTVKEKGGKPHGKPYPSPNGLRNPYRQKPQVWELSRLCPETSTKLFVHEFGYYKKKSNISNVSVLYKVIFLSTRHSRPF